MYSEPTMKTILAESGAQGTGSGEVQGSQVPLASGQHP